MKGGKTNKMKQKAKYSARIGAPFKKEDAQEIGEFIEQNKGKTTEELLEEIRKAKKNIIYSYIEWDDKKASEQYRLHQVRNIVNHIEIEIISLGKKEPTILEVPIRAFPSVSKVSSTGLLEGERIYVSMKEGMENPNYKTQIIERAKTELQNWIIRYRIYLELANPITKISEAITDINKVLGVIEES
jgi:hypothetical protein